MKQSYTQQDALVLASGGQDSTTCLFWAKQNFRKISAITFNYGQKHTAEIAVSSEICQKLKIDQKIVDITFLKDLVISNLFLGENDVNEGHQLQQDVPSSFVPYRNLLFITLASAWASTIGVNHLVTGVCETDYSGYADCRDVFIKSLQATLHLATDFKDKSIILHTPLMWLKKGEEFKLAEELGCLDFIIKETLTCYNGDLTLHNYGKGCGNCPACTLRKKGYEEFRRKYK